MHTDESFGLCVLTSLPSTSGKAWMADAESRATWAAARLSVESGWMLSGAASSTVMADAAAAISSSSTAAMRSGRSTPLAPISSSTPTRSMTMLTETNNRGRRLRSYRELLNQLTSDLLVATFQNRKG